MEPNYSPPTLKNPHQSHIILLSEIKKNFQIINGSYSNYLILIEKCYKFNISIKENQILRSVLIRNNEKINLSILDSVFSNN